MKKRHKNLKLDERSQKLERKRHKNLNLGDKKSQTSEKKTKKCKLRWQKLVNLNNQISKVIVKITKSKDVNQDTGDDP